MKLIDLINVVAFPSPAAFRRLCVETTKLFIPILICKVPAAFRRLCVETITAFRRHYYGISQPPSGGCVLKQSAKADGLEAGCQPPSGGCVLKPGESQSTPTVPNPAAFRRLCVETRD